MKRNTHYGTPSENKPSPCTVPGSGCLLLYLSHLTVPLSRFCSFSFSSQFSLSIVTSIDISHLVYHHSFPPSEPSLASPTRWLSTYLPSLAPMGPGLPHLSPHPPPLPAQPRLAPLTPGRVPTGTGVLALADCHHHPHQHPPIRPQHRRLGSR